MTRRGFNPCLICGNEAEGRKDGTVCSSCRQKVAGYDARRAEQSRDHVIVELPTPFVKGRAFPDVFDASVAERNEKGLGNKRSRLQSLLEEVFNSFESPERVAYTRLEGEGRSVRLEPRLAPHEEHGRSFNGHRSCIVPERFAQFFVDLQVFINGSLDEAYADGKREGSNLLASLASGDLTSSDFEQRAGIARAKE